MTAPDQAVGELRTSLAERRDPEFACALQRYFPGGVQALGVRSAEVAALASRYLGANPSPAEVRLETAEVLLHQAEFHEEVLLGFALLHKVVKRSFDVSLLDRCQSWLEGVVSNWAQCDDLCLKLLYPFLCGHPDLIPSTQVWIHSRSPWARRAANVSVIKLIRRKIGPEVYELPRSVIFGNSLHLLDDPDPYVQKSVGWLLKAAARFHRCEVIAFLEEHAGVMQRGTFRYATESFDPGLRHQLLTFGKEADRANPRPPPPRGRDAGA